MNRIVTIRQRIESQLIDREDDVIRQKKQNFCLLLQNSRFILSSQTQNSKKTTNFFFRMMLKKQFYLPSVTQYENLMFEEWATEDNRLKHWDQDEKQDELC